MEGGRGRVVRGIDGEKRDGGDRKHPPRSHRQPFRRNRVRDYGKAEFLNPGGSIKDRVALQASDSIAAPRSEGRPQPLTLRFSRAGDSPSFLCADSSGGPFNWGAQAGWDGL